MLPGGEAGAGVEQHAEARHVAHGGRARRAAGIEPSGQVQAGARRAWTMADSETVIDMDADREGHGVHELHPEPPTARPAHDAGEIGFFVEAEMDRLADAEPPRPPRRSGQSGIRRGSGCRDRCRSDRPMPEGTPCGGVLALLGAFLVAHCLGIGEEVPEIEPHLPSPLREAGCRVHITRFPTPHRDTVEIR